MKNRTRYRIAALVAGFALLPLGWWAWHDIGCPQYIPFLCDFPPPPPKPKPKVAQPVEPQPCPCPNNDCPGAPRPEGEI